MLWPGSTTAFRRATRKVDLGEYELIMRTAPTAAPTTARTVQEASA